MISRSASYAVRALSHLARFDSQEWVLSREIAGDLNLPHHFLAKILGALSSQGVLNSYRGKTGGFRLARPPGEIRLLDIVDPFDHVQDKSLCLLREGHCQEGTDCRLHHGWQHVLDTFYGFLESTTLADVIEDGPEKS